MVELFGIINNDRSQSISIQCDSLSYWRSDRPTELIDYLSNNIDDYCVEKFEVDYSRVFENVYVKSFDIELYMSDIVYENLMKKFQGTIAKYNKGIVDISLYEYNPWE